MGYACIKLNNYECLRSKSIGEPPIAPLLRSIVFSCFLLLTQFGIESRISSVSITVVVFLYKPED